MVEATPRGRAFRWLVFLVVIEVIYILTDFGFNAALLNASGGLVSDPDAIEKIEKVGRWIAGIGFGFALFGLLGSLNKKIPSFQSHFKILFLAMVIGAPTMYFGQKALVDFIIDNSSMETRHQAQFLALTKQGLQEGVIEIEGAPYSPSQASSPEELTFLSVIGGLLLNSESFTNTLINQKEPIIRELAKQQGHGQIEAHYKQYQSARETLHSTWETYRESSNRYLEEKGKIPASVDASWIDIQNDLKKGWEDYQSGVTDYFNQSRDLASRFRGDIQDAVNRFRSCRNNRACKDRVLKAYEQRAGNVLHRVPALQAWCEAVEVSTTDRFLRGVFSLGMTELIDGANRDVHCPGSNEHLTGMVMRANIQIFERESGGYLPTISSPIEFEQHSATIKKIRDDLVGKGIQLPSNWKGNPNTYKLAAREYAESQLDAKWDQEVRRKINHHLPPGMSYAQFMQSNLVQNRLKSSMGDFYVSGMSLDWNQKIFKERVIDPYMEKEIKQRVREMEAEASEFANGANLEEKGKAYLRSLIVPPIALFLSLFFSLLALAKLPLRIFDAISIMMGRHLPKGYKLGALIFMVAMIAVLPGLIWKNKFSESPAFAYAMDAIKEHQPAPYSLTMDWLIRAEPTIYPLGQMILIESGLDNRDTHHLDSE